MAKGDHQRMEDQIGSQSKQITAGQQTNNTALSSANEGFQNSYNQGSGVNLGTYNDMMGKYNDLYNNPFGNVNGVGGGELGAGGGGAMPGYGEQRGIYSNLANNGGGYGWDAGMRGAMDKSIAGYGNFADTGGFSNQNLTDIRARSLAPIRGVYSNAQNELSRSRSLGGASPNFAAAQARMAREMGHTTADAATNAEAGIAEMVQQGKLAGLSGLSQTGAAGQGLSTNIDQLNAQMKLAGLSGLMNFDNQLCSQAASAGARSDQNAMDYYKARMGALGGMNDLYGTNPALLSVTGNQLLQSGQNMLGNQQNQNQGSQILLGGQNMLSNTQGNWGAAMDNIGSGLSTAGRIGAAVGTLGGSEMIGSMINGGNGQGWGGLPQMSQNPYGQMPSYFGGQMPSYIQGTPYDPNTRYTG